MSGASPFVTTEISLYPLRQAVEPPVIAFIQALRGEPGIEVVSNAMSTQVRGRLEDVNRALQRCMADVLAGPEPVVFVTKTLNLDLDIGTAPDLD